MDFSLGAVAVRCGGQGAQAAEPRIVVGSVSSSPIRLPGAEGVIAAEGLSDAAIDAAVERIREALGEVTNLYGRATYKKQIAKTLVRRALVQIRDMQEPL